MSSHRDTAVRLDQADPLAAFRDRFLITDSDVCYLDGNSLGRLPLDTEGVVTAFLRDGWGAKVVEGWSEWIDLAETVGEVVGRAALGAAPGQVLVADTTSLNFYRACRAALAARPERRTIVTDRANFPTDRYLLEGIAAELGMTLIFIDDEITETTAGREHELVTPERLLPYLSDDVALVTLSVVAYRSGALHDVAALTALAREHGALAVWDASHAVGCVDLQFDRDDVDLAVGCTYKYGNSGPGAPAWLYVRRELQDRLDMPINGWFAQRDQFAMGQGFQRADGMRGFQIASPSVIGLLCVRTAFSMIAEAGIERIHAKARAGTAMMVDLHDEWLAPLGFTLLTPRDPALRGGHITLHHPDAAAIARGLRADCKVVPDYREPRGIRLAMSPLPTTYVEVHDGFERLRDFAASGEYRRHTAATSTVT